MSVTDTTNNVVEFLINGNEDHNVKLVVKIWNDNGWKLYITRKMPDYWGDEESEIKTSIYLGGGEKSKIINGFADAYNDIISDNRSRCHKVNGMELTDCILLSGYTEINLLYPPEEKMYIQFGYSADLFCKMWIDVDMELLSDMVRSLRSLL